MTKTEAFNKAKTMSLQGIHYEKIATTLNEAGSKTARGFPWNTASVSYVLTSKGVRRFKKHRADKKRAPTEPAKPAAPQRGASKWDVLKAIEACSDINGSAKKALLDLAFRELNK